MKLCAWIVLSIVGVIGCVTTTSHADLLVCSENTDSVLLFNTNGSFVRTLVQTGSGGLEDPHALAIGPDGTLYVVSHSTNSVKRYDLQTGSYIDDFVSDGVGGLNRPTGMSFGPDQNGDGTVDLFVASALSNEVRCFDGVTGDFVAVAATVSAPDGIIFSSDGSHLFVVSNDTHSIWRFGLGPDAAPTNTPFATGISFFPTAIALGPDYNLFVSAHVGNHIARLDGRTGLAVEPSVGDGAGNLDRPQGLAFGPDGLLYVCSQETDNIKRFDAKTGTLVDEFVGSNAGGLDKPVALLFVHRPLPAGDIDHDGDVDVDDLLALINNWTVPRR